MISFLDMTARHKTDKFCKLKGLSETATSYKYRSLAAGGPIWSSPASHSSDRSVVFLDAHIQSLRIPAERVKQVLIPGVLKTVADRAFFVLVSRHESPRAPHAPPTPSAMGNTQAVPTSDSTHPISAGPNSVQSSLSTFGKS
jgi:hypothetical protein